MPIYDLFFFLSIAAGFLMALNLGANDVANAIGPVAAIYMISRQHALLAEAEVPIAAFTSKVARKSSERFECSEIKSPGTRRLSDP